MSAAASGMKLTDEQLYQDKMTAVSPIQPIR